tara:strand:+ start:3433 stop:4407 length:975 start_codon:yes stop_codon:yes gene_type:complete
MLSLYNKKDSILLAGPFPKPLGGVSVHTKRLFHLLDNQGLNVKKFKLNKRKIPGLQWSLFLVHLAFNRYDVVHLQLFEPLFYKIVLLICKLKKTELILTIHNPHVSSRIKENIALLNQTDVIVMVGGHIVDSYNSSGVELTTEIKVISSYLPPNNKDEVNILKTYPTELNAFIKKFDKTILVSAYKLIITNEGVDLYGIDKSIELLKELIINNNSIGLIIAIADDGYNVEYYSILKERIKQDGLDENVLFLGGQREIWPLFKSVNLFLRPTVYDGFGISVAEAIDMGCPAIASNVCKRAEGAIIYDYFNQKGLYLSSKKVLLEE